MRLCPCCPASTGRSFPLPFSGHDPATPWREARRRGRRTVVSGQPAAEAVEPWKQHALVDVGLVEVVPDLPLEPCRNPNLAAQLWMACEALVEAPRGAPHQGANAHLLQ